MQGMVALQPAVIFTLPFYGNLRVIGLAVVAVVGVGAYKFIFGFSKLAPPNAGYPSQKGFHQEIQIPLRYILINGGSFGDKQKFFMGGG